MPEIRDPQEWPQQPPCTPRLPSSSFPPEGAPQLLQRRQTLQDAKVHVHTDKADFNYGLSVPFMTLSLKLPKKQNTKKYLNVQSWDPRKAGGAGSIEGGLWAPHLTSQDLSTEGTVHTRSKCAPTGVLPIWTCARLTGGPQPDWPYRCPPFREVGPGHSLLWEHSSRLLTRNHTILSFLGSSPS